MSRLDPHLDSAIDAFALSLKVKALKSQELGRKGWAIPDWEEACREQMLEHIKKGDPLDVATYCLFMWYHEWSTNG